MGSTLSFILDPIGETVADAIGMNSPSDYALSAPWEYPDMWKEDWRAIKHLLVPDMRRDREQTTNSANTARRLIYGRARVGIQMAYACTSGAQSEFLHIIGVFCGHPIAQFESVWLDDKLSSDASIAPFFYYELYDGTQTTTCQAMISASGGLWTSAHVLKGCPYIYAKLTYDEAAFPNGLPAIKAVIKGREVYDPRTGLTAWSDNPVLCARDYMLLANEFGGMGCSLDEIGRASWRERV